MCVSLALSLPASALSLLAGLVPQIHIPRMSVSHARRVVRTQEPTIQMRRKLQKKRRERAEREESEEDLNKVDDNMQPSALANEELGIPRQDEGVISDAPHPGERAEIRGEKGDFEKIVGEVVSSNGDMKSVEERLRELMDDQVCEYLVFGGVRRRRASA